MNRYESYDSSEGHDPTQPFVAAFNIWENSVRERYSIDTELANKYVQLVNLYREKCNEFEREKRNAMLWEKEQRMAEKELNGLKSAAVSTHSSGISFKVNSKAVTT